MADDSNTQLPRVLVTGASGLLGRAVLARFQRDGEFDVTGCGFSRVAPPLIKLDLTDASAVEHLLRSLQPTLVINIAAERHPDVCEKQGGAQTAPLNIDAVWNLARLAEQHHAGFIQISTDYLWRGDAAPYSEDSPTSPPNVYGLQKRRAEHAALAAHHAAVVLRVPVLFGPTHDLTESAVTMFAVIVAAGEKLATVDDWQVRVPTYTPDIAETLVRMAGALAGNRLPGGIYHYSSRDRVTRWGLCLLCADLLGGLPISHLTRLEGAPPGAPRPYDCQLRTDKLEALGLAAPCTPLREALSSVLLQPGGGGLPAQAPAAAATAVNTAPPPTIVWLSGKSGAGKTFTGDALALLAGFRHLDGDALFWSKVPGDKALVANLIAAFGHWFEGNPAPPELWQPYYAMQCARVCEELDAGNTKVAISLSVYHRETRDFLRAQLPGHMFVLLHCSSEELVHRARVRFGEYAASRGQTCAEAFEAAHKAPFSEAAWEEKTRSMLRGMQPLAPEETRPGGGCAEVDVTVGDHWEALFRLLQLGPAPSVVPVAQIAEVNYARFRAHAQKGEGGGKAAAAEGGDKAAVGDA